MPLLFKIWYQYGINPCCPDHPIQHKPLTTTCGWCNTPVHFWQWVLVNPGWAKAEPFKSFIEKAYIAEEAKTKKFTPL